MSAAPDPAATHALQRAFASHVRDPAHAPAPAGIEPRRMQVYSELFFNNVESLVSANFPVMRSLYGDDEWRAFVRAFYRDHRCHTPLFTDLARELMRYLETRNDAGDAPFLAELAHYEWSELALTIDEAEIADAAHDPRGDVVDGVPVVSPLARVLAYRFPVHRIRPDYRPDDAPAQPTLILLVRDRSDDIRFLEIDALTALLFERLGANTAATGRAVLDALLTELGRDDETVRASGLAILNRLRERDALLGTRPA
ncbi:MAG: putative DNA-binding domain-containing protein [Rhodanobacteraceae bacterium]